MEEKKTFEPANADSWKITVVPQKTGRSRRMTEEGDVSDQTDSDDEVIEVVNAGGRIFYPNDEPEELYYMAWAAKFSHVETPSWVGGHPMMPSSVKWPQCGCHGPLKFCWQIAEDDNTLLLCFMCVTVDDSKWIWPKTKCVSRENYADICIINHTSHVFCYKFIRVSQAATLKLRDSEEPFLPRQYLKLEEVKLVKPDYEFESNDSNHLVGNSYVSHDSYLNQTTDLQRSAFNNAAFLFKTMGIKDQEDLTAGHGYIAMNENADLFPFWSAPNPGVFNVSRGLSMSHTF